MSHKTTKATQHAAVGQGLAVGCLMLGYSELPSQKMNVELAFRKAWRGWPHAQQFPQVKASFERDDILTIMRKSSNRRQITVAYWEVDRTLRPVLTDGYDLNDAEELIADFYDLPAEQWKQLAQSFTNDLHHAS